ncbi:MBL fold metallo-hydrolase [Aridibaculum aurantiacum]|uniref:MBL fold metallo-hydrolase n=1 Tax=Aridibaculum aurantiacum TaxID=2810307 RepID=UPI001A968ECE|nr:MBL fold metallo-hydrolase [Aridibaculum aurantiacum]
MNKERKVPAGAFTVAPGIWGMKDKIVNFYMIEDQQSGGWVLIDAGLKWSYGKIKSMATKLFGKESKPTCIVLTHGHFDHVGSVARLAEEWEVPVFAHYMEIPYLTGKSSYPPPDPSVGGGMMSAMAFMYPKTPINIWQHVRVLPNDETIPGLNGWKYIHTPGHAPGHISLFREDDKILIAGDAFVTTKQESAISSMTNRRELSGPPKYFTTDWDAAEASVRKLAYLHPNVAATGHGAPMEGAELKESLEHLVKNFREIALPAQGRYLHQPAVADVNGVVYVPEKQNAASNGMVWKAFSVSAAIALGFVISNISTKRRRLRYYKQDMLNFEYNY